MFPLCSDSSLGRYALKNVSRSSLIVSACVVGMTNTPPGPTANSRRRLTNQKLGWLEVTMVSSLIGYRGPQLLRQVTRAGIDVGAMDRSGIGCDLLIAHSERGGRAAEHGGVDCSGRHRVDPNVLVGVLERGDLGQ